MIDLKNETEQNLDTPRWRRRNSKLIEHLATCVEWLLGGLTSVDDGVSARRRLFGPFTRCKRRVRGRRGSVPAAGDQAAEAVLLQQLQARVRGAGYLVLHGRARTQDY